MKAALLFAFFATVGAEVNAKGSCPCYYDGRIHHCNPSPFAGDKRCVCGPHRSDWKTPEQCKEPAPLTTTPPTRSCPCFYDGRIHDCKPSPFAGDKRCVCGPHRSDWKTPEQCKEPAQLTETSPTRSCPCYYDGRIHDCKPSPFAGDKRCVCGPHRSDWKSPEQCKEPAPLTTTPPTPPPQTEMSCSNDFCNSLNNDNDRYNFGQLVVEDKSCLTKGGTGCNARGKSQICRFCTWTGDHLTPPCPKCACDQQGLNGCGSPSAEVAFNTTKAVIV